MRVWLTALASIQTINCLVGTGTSASHASWSAKSLISSGCWMELGGTMVGHYRCAGDNVSVTVTGVKVNPGDIVTADEDGVVVVPKGHTADVLKKAQELDYIEHSTIPYIEKFRSIKEAVAKFGRI
jgi:hypothetical protein